MTESAENRIVENQEVVVGGYPGIELVEEYRDETKPEYDWNIKENLLACLQFHENFPFPEWVFQKFIVENQHYARDTDTLTSQSQQQSDFADFELPIEEIPETIEIDSEDGTYEEKIILKYKKAVWKNGILLDLPVEEKGKYLLVPVEVTRSIETKLILLKVEGKDRSIFRKALTTILNSFGTASGAEQFAVCNCPLCQEIENDNPGAAYRIHYNYLQNLYDKYVPKVQCYSSGTECLLDEISILDRPEVKVAIIHEEIEDKQFCKKAKEQFKLSELRMDIWDRSRILAGDNKQWFVKKSSGQIDITR